MSDDVTSVLTMISSVASAITALGPVSYFLALGLVSAISGVIFKVVRSGKSTAR